MPIYTNPTIRDTYLEDYTSPLGQVSATAFGEAATSGLGDLMRWDELGMAQMGLEEPSWADLAFSTYFGRELTGKKGARLDALTARQRIKEAGMDLTVPDDGIYEPALNILMDRKRQEMRRADIYNRGPSGVVPFVGKYGSMLVGSLMDPINVASAFIPIVGEARYAGMLAKAGGAFGRAGVRARVGAAEGALGAAIVEPFTYIPRTQEQADYGIADSLLNIGIGTALGGGLHVGIGAAADAIRAGRSPKQAQPDPGSSSALRLTRAGYQARNEALHTGVSQAVSGRQINIEPVITYAEQARATGRVSTQAAGGREPAAPAALAAPAAAPPVQARFGEEMRAPGAQEFVVPDELKGVEGIRVWHGTTAEFEQFRRSAETRRTGEGSAAFGEGLYVGEATAVGQRYQQVTAYKQAVKEFRDALPDDADFDDITRLLGTDHFTPQQARVLRALKKEDWLGFDYPAQAISAAFRELDAFDPPQELRDAVAAAGNLYEVQLHASPDDFMDWDKSRDQMSAKAQSALRPLIADLNRQADDMMELASTFETGSAQWHQMRDQANAMRLDPYPTGEEIYKALSVGVGKQAASDILHKAGLSGIKFLDKGSRAAPAESPKTSNYVVFDDSQLQVLKRNDQKISELVRPDQLMAAAKASFLPENSRMYDAEILRMADEQIKAAPKDEVFPDESLTEEMENTSALASAMDAAREAKVRPRMKQGRPADPELKMPSRPVLAILKNMGGVKPNTPLAQELHAMGITAKKAPGLFRQTGRGAADTLVASEHPEFARAGLSEDDYVPEATVLEAIRDEIFGHPWRSPTQEEDIAAYRRAIDELEGTSREEGPMPGEGAPPITGEEGETQFGAQLREHEESFQAMFDREMAAADTVIEDANAFGQAVNALAECQLTRGV